MIDIIPSKDMQKLIEETGIVFSDHEKATLIWNAKHCKRHTMIASLQELADQTSDERTRVQIEERLQYEEKKLATFEENQEGTYIYVVVDETGCSCGYFLKADTAKRYAIENAKKHQEIFTVEKQQLIVGDEIPMVKIRENVNPNLCLNDNFKETVEYEGREVSSLTLDSDGDIVRIWSKEMSREEALWVDPYSTERFEYQYIDIPYPFDSGVPVRDIITGEYGVAATSQTIWNTISKKIDQGQYADYSDMFVVVMFLTAQGVWSHEHINPIHLEIGRPKLSDPMFAAVEALCEYYIGTAESRPGCEDKVLRICRDYAESQRKKSPAENAKKVEDVLS